MAIIEHILLFLFLYIYFYRLTEYKQRYFNRYYWKILFFPIILYCLILGCRYGWGPDYLWYKERFEHPFDYEDENWGFLQLNLFIAGIGGNYVVAYMVYSLLFIIGALILIKDYEEKKYMIACFIPATILLSTSTIRQSVATSFVFVALYALQNKKWLLFIFMFGITYSIHPAALIVLFFPFSFWIIGRSIPWKYMIIAYCIALILSQLVASIFSNTLNSLVPFLLTDSKFDGYLENSDRWFNTEYGNEERIQSLGGIIMSSLFYCGTFILSGIALTKRPNLKVAYLLNTIFIGALIIRVFMVLEIMKRIGESLYQLYFIPLGYAIFVLIYYKSMYSKREYVICLSSLVTILLYLILFHGRFIFFTGDPPKAFIWN